MPNSKKARIIFDGSPLRYLHTGLGQFSYYLIKEFALHSKEKNFSFLVHRGSREYIKEFTESFVAITWLRRHVPRSLIPALFRNYDLWHASSEITRFTNFPGSTKVLATLHGLHFLDEDPPEVAKKKLDEVQRLVNKTHALATDSAYSEGVIRKHLDIGNRPLKVIHLGVPDRSSQSVKKPAATPSTKFIFSVGSFFERKNFHVLLPMLQQLEGYTLVLAGEHKRKYGEHIKKEIQRLGISDRVLLTGEIDEAEKNWWYQNCEAFVFPSLSEGFGIPVLEAMQFGKPVFCSRYGSLPEVGSVHSFYWENFEPGYMKNLYTEKIKLFYQNKELETHCREYASGFTWKKTAESYLAYYAELLQ